MNSCACFPSCYVCTNYDYYVFQFDSIRRDGGQWWYERIWLLSLQNESLYDVSKGKQFDSYSNKCFMAMWLWRPPVTLRLWIWIPLQTFFLFIGTLISCPDASLCKLSSLWWRHHYILRATISKTSTGDVKTNSLTSWMYSRNVWPQGCVMIALQFIIMNCGSVPENPTLRECKINFNVHWKRLFVTTVASNLSDNLVKDCGPLEWYRLLWRSSQGEKRRPMPWDESFDQLLMSCFE